MARRCRPRFVLLLLFILFFSALPAQAQDGFLTLLPQARADYRFDYRGDRTPIEITVETSEGVELEIYSPEQDRPVGRGSRRANELRWSGRFTTPGVYHAIVINQSPGPILYRITIRGESVSGIARVIQDVTDPSAQVTTQNGRRTLTVNLPPGAGIGAVRLTAPTEPPTCTPAGQLPPVIVSSIKLCPNEIYPPLRLVGNGIGLFGDGARSAVIVSIGRQFAVTIEGVNNWIEDVVIQSSPDAADAGAFLCQYEECIFPTQPQETILNGGLSYGGGILVKGSGTVIHNVRVRGGTIGVATLNGRSNYLIGNDLSYLNGWGSFNIASVDSYFIGNTFNYNNHGCTTPHGRKFEHGCETAGWVCLACRNNLIARNHCELSGNCYYMSGERGLGSNHNRFLANYCAGSPNNCFEFTFSQGNTLQDNIATADPQTGAACKYPFWIGGSTVYFGDNTWECAISPEEAMTHAVQSTNIPTVALALDGTPRPLFTSSQSQPTKVAAKPTPQTRLKPCKRKLQLRMLASWTKFNQWIRCVTRPISLVR